VGADGSHSNVSGSAALANTGSGGGGGGRTNINTTASGGAGGSGIVVIRYPAYLAPAPTVVGANTYTLARYGVHVWVSSGSITF